MLLQRLLLLAAVAAAQLPVGPVLTVTSPGDDPDDSATLRSAILRANDLGSAKVGAGFSGVS